MKCPKCRKAEMVTEVVNRYHYTESGLPNVYIDGVEVRRCPNDGEEVVGFRNLLGLHRAIAGALIAKPKRLTGDEIRFLRKYIGWSGEDFAKHIDATVGTVSRWETGAKLMSRMAESLLRLMVATTAPVPNYDLDQLARLEGDATTAKAARVDVRSTGKDWQAAIAA